MAYHYIPEPQIRSYVEAIMKAYGFNDQESFDITDVLLTADLYGIESHGIQRLIRYHKGILSGDIVPTAKPEILYETPISALIDAHCAMGQVVSVDAMKLAIKKAKEFGFGAVTIRRSNHYGIAGYYTAMAAEEDLIGMCFTNTEAIAVPTYGKKAMLGTNPIAFSMPADPVNFLYDVATTVVPRGKLEVYSKKGEPLPVDGWGVDENGNDSRDAQRVIDNIINKAGGGILPIGGSTELTGSHKGYGLGLIVEILTSVLADGTTSNHVARSGNGDTCETFFALDYGIFGDKASRKARMSTLLQELRDSPKADGHDRIYTHGEKEMESKADKLKNGIPVNDKTIEELREIGAYAKLDFDSLITFIK